MIEADHKQGRYAATVPWSEDGERPEICQMRPLSQYYQGRTALPAGGSFFSESHTSKLAGLYAKGTAVGEPTELP